MAERNDERFIMIVRRQKSFREGGEDRTNIFRDAQEVFDIWLAIHADLAVMALSDELQERVVSNRQINILRLPCLAEPRKFMSFIIYLTLAVKAVSPI
jgi:hypothetical protein